MKVRIFKSLVFFAAVFGMKAYAGADTYDLGKFKVAECSNDKGKQLYAEWYGKAVSVTITREGELFTHEDVVSYRIGDQDKWLEWRVWKKKSTKGEDSGAYTTPQFFNYPDFGRIEVESVYWERFCYPGHCFPRTLDRSTTMVAFKIENQDLKFSSTTFDTSYDYFSGKLISSTQKSFSCRMTRLP